MVFLVQRRKICDLFKIKAKVHLLILVKDIFAAEKQIRCDNSFLFISTKCVALSFFIPTHQPLWLCDFW